MVHPLPQKSQGESINWKALDCFTFLLARHLAKPLGTWNRLAKPGTPVMILSIICKSHIEEVRGNLSNPFFCAFFFFEKIVYVQKHPREVDMCRNRVPHINQFILSKYSQHPVQENQYLETVERAGQHRPSLSPPVRHQYTNHMPHHLDI